MGENKFCLHWNDFETNMIVALKDLREEKDFFDVTIVCEDSQIQAHKVILSACSTFFRNLLRRNPHQHPLLYLKGVKYKDLLAILNFMYNGEVNIDQEELKEFLTVAEDLKVKGLAQKMALPTFPTKMTTTSGTINTINQPVNPSIQKRESNEKEPAKKRLRPNLASTTKQVFTPVRTHQQDKNDDILEVVPVQPVIKESPNLKESPKDYHSQTPRKASQNKTPAPKILDQCIQEAEINTVQESEKSQEIVLKNKNKTLKLTPIKGSVAMDTTNDVITPRTVKILPKNLMMSPKVTPGQFISKHGRISSPIQFVPMNLEYDFSSIKQFSTAWRCSICQKISSTRKIALEHLKATHSKKEKK